MKAAANLALAASAERPLTPQQRKFNQLVRKIEQARAELLAWQEQAPLFAQAHDQRMRPLQGEYAACQQAMVRKLDAMLARTGWTKAQRGTMCQILCSVAGQLLEDEQTDAGLATAIKALYDKHADIDFDTENRESIAAMKNLLETITGVDLGDEALETEEGLFARTQERLRAKVQDDKRDPPPRPARPSAAARRREAEAEQATQSMREVYRKLASALHPDRAADGPDRVARTALMQRVNQAYDAKDLLALFALQLEIEQVDMEHLARATAECAQHYNRVLADQLAALQAQIQARRAVFYMDFEIDPFLRLNPHKLGMLLEREASALRAMIAGARRDLRQLDDPASAKRWLKRMHRQQQSLDTVLPFDFPF
ncbi:MAG: J domain-containing protein [Burkholderiaceae bacterium]|nr:J domain-containing protein [Burkholderiaceae bacterium]